MALPDNFNPSEHLQSVVMQVHNRIVREHFEIPGDNEPDISTPDESLKRACLISERDSWPMMLSRQNLFYLALGNFDLVQQAMYAIPVTTFQDQLEYKPQITVVFVETSADAKLKNRQRVRAEVSIRLMNESLTSITQADITTYRNRVTSTFKTPKFQWKKGENKYSYVDKQNGHNMLITAFDEFNAKKVIEAMLDLAAQQPNWDCLTESTNNRNYQTAKFQTVLGKSRRMPQRRPITDVHFYRAELKLWGVEDITLASARVR